MSDDWLKHNALIPKSRSFELPRPRIMSVLSGVPDFPVTVVKAGAGYGKTTAVSNYVRQSGLLTRWLTIREGDRYGVRFVERLSGVVLPQEVPESVHQRILGAAHSPLTWIVSAQWTAELLATYVHEECILVIDDFHVVDDDAAVLQWIDEFLRNMPVNVHVLFVTRTSPGVGYMETLGLSGDVLWIRERELAFTEDEIGFLFRGTQGESVANTPSLNHQQANTLLRRTGGMAMVLSMLLRDWKQYAEFSRLQAALDERAPIQNQVGRLFVGDLTGEQQEFLRSTCLFTPLVPAMCDAVLNRTDSAKVLSELERKGYIAIAEERTGYELHPLVRDHLAASLALDERTSLLTAAATWHLNRGEEMRAISYLFEFPNQQRVGESLLRYIPDYLDRGQISTVQGWLDRLTQETIESSPRLLLAKAEVARHTNNFSEAIHHYATAKSLAQSTHDASTAAKAEMGHARLYLDTIQPAQAIAHIREARKWIPQADRLARTSLLQLTFENSINEGRVTRASRLLTILSQLPGANIMNNNSDARLLLRMGRIHDVIAALKPRLSTDAIDGRTALSHREATLLLSLMYVMIGEGDKAKEQAERGYLVGHSLHSPFVSAVGFIRLGHAQHFLDPLSDQALSSYQEAVGRMDEMQVPRGKSEALLGLCLAHGYRRQFALARRYAQEGISIAMKAGDLWMASFVRIGYGQVAAVNEMFDVAAQEFEQCARDFHECNDGLLETTSQLWLAWNLHRLGDKRCHEVFDTVLEDAERYNCRFVLERATFCGMRDIQAIVPLVKDHAAQGHGGRNALSLLHQLSGSDLEYHPGYTLRVQTLGSFSVWRGFAEVSRKEWQREKARQVFQFLLTHRGRFMHREEICEQLWGEMDASAAERDFKVALNALSSVLEPNKPGRGPSIFIVRQGGLYGLINHEMLQVDKDLFLKHLRDAEAEADDARRRSLLGHAIETYRGDYLSEVRYESWCTHERDNLRTLFIGAAVQYAQLSFQAQQYQDAISACERVLELDATWEDAYVCLMRVHAATYNRPMVVQTYRTCERVLREELGVAPLPSTQAVYEDVMGRTGNVS